VQISCLRGSDEESTQRKGNYQPEKQGSAAIDHESLRIEHWAQGRLSAWDRPPCSKGKQGVVCIRFIGLLNQEIFQPRRTGKLSQPVIATPA